MFFLPVPQQAAASVNDKLVHVLIFFVLMMLANQSFPDSNLLVLVLLLTVYGIGH